MLSSPLKKNGEHYEMDFAQMESMVDEHTKMMILCNPHNPTGRAWTKEELVQVADFCREHDLILFTDEIQHSWSYCFLYDNSKRKIKKRDRGYY